MALCGNQSPWWEVPCKWAYVVHFRNGLRDIEATIFPELIGSLASIERYNELPWWHYYIVLKLDLGLGSFILYICSVFQPALFSVFSVFVLSMPHMWKASLVNTTPVQKWIDL